MSRVGRFVAALAVAALGVVPGTADAQFQGFERIRAYDVAIEVLPSGRIHVVETIDYDFGAQQRHGIIRNIPVRFQLDDEYDRVYPMSGIRVTGSPGTPTDVDVSDASGNKVLKIGDPDRTITGEHRYVIAYDVDGAINRFESHDELFWNAVGDEWSVLVERVTVSVSAPAAVETVACFAGPRGSSTPCASSSARGTTASYRHGLVSPGQAVSVVAALPNGTVSSPGPIRKERWTFDKAFARSREALGLSALVLIAGLAGVAYLVWRGGRDRHWAGLVPGLDPMGDASVPEEPVPAFGRGEVSVEYEPDDAMRPALMGVLLDERADPLDVTATIVDLAVRRYLTIEELPRKGLFRRRDWKLVYLGGPAEGLRRWESTLLAALFKSGEETTASQLKNRFHPDLKMIQEQLYEDVVAHGWFTRRPDHVRGRWHTIAVVGLLAAGGLTYLLARFTHLGLVGVSSFVPALAFLALHHRMPFRTARGTAALDRAKAFRRYLVTAESNQLQFEEREGIFARYLPYAVVLGETERWARAFANLGDKQQQELYWYSGPNGWSAMDFTDSISSFSNVTAGTLASTPGGVGGSSGFSGGGGGAGGGGGGGGGGSW